MVECDYVSIGRFLLWGGRGEARRLRRYRKLKSVLFYVRCEFGGRCVTTIDGGVVKSKCQSAFPSVRRGLRISNETSLNVNSMAGRGNRNQIILSKCFEK